MNNDKLGELSYFVFDHSERLPNDFYVDLMNLIKLCYEKNGYSFQIIHDYIKKNEKRIEENLLKEIKEKIPCNETFIVPIDYETLVENETRPVLLYFKYTLYILAINVIIIYSYITFN